MASEAVFVAMHHIHHCIDNFKVLVDKLGRNLGELADVDNRSRTVFIEGGGTCEETATAALDHYQLRNETSGLLANLLASTMHKT